MSLAKTLWEENRDIAEACLNHPFVQELGTGKLPILYFQRYVAQDAYFLDAFARAYALALAHSPDRHGMRDFFTLLAGALEELHLHAGYADRWGVDLANVSPVKATLAYTDFLLATAALRGLGEICAAMTPCMRLYAFLGQVLASDPIAQEHPYREWIETYSSTSFDVLAKQLENLLDRYAQDVPGVHWAYRRAMELELGFFDAQYGEGKG